jgi:hypothetical protein
MTTTLLTKLSLELIIELSLVLSLLVVAWLTTLIMTIVACTLTLGAWVVTRVGVNLTRVVVDGTAKSETSKCAESG